MKEYEMTQEQLYKIMMEAKDSTLQKQTDKIKNITRPKETTKTAWESLGEEMGFDYRTVTPSGRGDKFFSAEPN